MRATWTSLFYKELHEQKGIFKKSALSIHSNPALHADRDEVRHLPHEPVRFAYIGQLEEHKGIFQLLTAFSTVLNSGANVELWVVGGGTQSAKVREICGSLEYTHFLGFVPNAELRDRVFSQIDYLVVPSLCYENSPTVIYEAAINSIPVIAADIGGVSELVQDGETGFTYSSADSQALQAALERGIAAHTVSKKMGERARMRMKDNTVFSYCNYLLSL